MMTINPKIARDAEELIRIRGITKPEDIDLEAIAKTLHADVEELPLVGCEARIIGNNKEATISINSRSSYGRKRFSLGHELGHWQLHRGMNFSCRNEDIGSSLNTNKLREREADEFSANLLMPDFLFMPLARSCRKFDFKAVEDMSTRFRTSFLSTAIRFVDSNVIPSIIICHDSNKRQWFKCSRDIPGHWFPQDSLDQYSSAFDILFKGEEKDPHQQKVSASSWFDLDGIEEYEVLEQSKPYGQDSVLTFLEFFDEDMLEDYLPGLRGSRNLRW
jgi:hypothetical protein